MSDCVHESSNGHGDTVIDALLVAVQSLLGLRPDPGVAADAPEAPDNFIKEGWSTSIKLSMSLNMHSMVEKCSSLLNVIVHYAPNDLATCCDRILPFLDNYVALAETQVQILAQWTKSLLKLDQVLCTVAHSIAKDGFCQPKEMEEAGDAKDGGEAMEGTGLGEGTGMENVSKEIQDESQVEGLQGESGDGDDDVERAEEDNAIEMADDFGGKMQDVPEKEDMEGEEDEGEDEEEPDDQLGELDAGDETAVDEKLWGDEQGPDTRDDKSKRSDQDNSTKTDGQRDLTAKEDEQTRDHGGKEQPEDRKQEAKAEQDLAEKNKTDEGLEEMDEDQQEQDDTSGAGAPVDDYLQTAETLDLPDDIDMEEGKAPQEEDKAEDDRSDDAMSEMEESKQGKVPEGPPETVEDEDELEGQNGDDGVPGDAVDDTTADTDKDATQPDLSPGDGSGNGASTNVQATSTDTSPPEEPDASQEFVGGSAHNASSSGADEP